MTETSSRKGLLTGLHCPRCDYDLSGTAVFRCPECGAAFTEAELHKPDPRRYPTLTLVLALLLMAATLYLSGAAVWARMRWTELTQPGATAAFNEVEEWVQTARNASCGLYVVTPLLFMFSLALIADGIRWRSAVGVGLAGVLLALLIFGRWVLTEGRLWI